MASLSPPPTLYHVPKTISSPIYQALLELNLVDNPIRVETLTFAQLKTPEHLQRNPMGSSPTFVDALAGIDIWESGAVMTYLLERYDTQHVLHPNISKVSLKDHANYLHLMLYIVATVYPFMASLYLHTLKPHEQQDPEYLQKGKDTWKTKLAPTLAKFLGESDFFMGSSLSAVDLLAAKPLNNAQSMGVLSQEEHPTLYKLFLKIKSLPSFAIAYQVPEEETPAKSRKACPECRSMVLVPADDDDN